ncbi:MAG: cell wall hydrolase/autolysin [Acidobacteriaceae bacterium]|nr:cell wall hydrolase/autolysin [Acidobacteriaceae bacterium]
MGLRKTMRMGWLRCAGGAAVLCCCGVVHGATALRSAAYAKTPRQRSAKAPVKVELTPWEAAERGRETLEAIPDASRTKAQYAAAMDAFRAVYHDRPGDTHAPTAVFTVAELLAEQGRGLHDSKSLKAAVGQYEFLRVQYPASSLRVAALLAQGQIYGNDLGDPASAKERYSLLVKQFPGSMKAEEARVALEALEQRRGSKTHELAATTRNKERGFDQAAASRAINSDAQTGATQSSRDRARVASASTMPTASGNGANTSALGAMPATGASAAGTSDPRRGVAAPVDAPMDTGTPVSASNAPIPGPSNMGRVVARTSDQPAQVTGIRHWSTATYTRVAIDLGDDVTFEAARVPNPDRIYFDLHGTRLARELAGKSFTVTDDGFLKKIRTAQFSDDMTRVVLDVNDVTEYSAFLLPNPYRLIIDIHGGRGQGGAPTPSTAQSQSIASGVNAPNPNNPTAPMMILPVPPPVSATVVKPTMSRPVPNTVSTRSANSTEIASLSAQPGRVEATSVPTSKDQFLGSKAQPSDSRAVVGGNLPANDDLSAVVGTGAPETTSSGKAGTRGKKGRVIREDSSPARAAVPTADGETSLVRALGLKIGRIVIDAGHGGHDSGTIGVDGIEEKDVVLDVALRVGKMLHDRLGAEVVYTRSDDTFIPLETRTAIANKAQADLFLSIHANSSSDSSARGVETYYLNFTSSPDALETAARENAVSDQSIHQLSDLVKKIALKDKIAESREFASDVEASLYGGLQRGNAGLKDRGVKKAPFVVLIGANMPSILAEISFVTNPKDATQLQQPEYRQRVAESLFKGVAKYSSGLSGIKGPTERASVK